MHGSGSEKEREESYGGLSLPCALCFDYFAVKCNPHEILSTPVWKIESLRLFLESCWNVCHRRGAGETLTGDDLEALSSIKDAISESFSGKIEFEIEMFSQILHVFFEWMRSMGETNETLDVWKRRTIDSLVYHLHRSGELETILRFGEIREDLLDAHAQNLLQNYRSNLLKV